MSKPTKTSVHYRPISIPKATFDRFLKLKNWTRAFAVYCFYYYTAVWQETSCPRATVDYVAKGCGLSPDTIRKVRKILKDMGLVEDVQTRDENNQFSKRYTKVSYYENSRTHGFPYYGKSRNTGTGEVNAYSNGKGNAYSNGKGNARTRRGKKRRDRECPKTLDISYHTSKSPRHKLAILLYKAIPPSYKTTAHKTHLPKKVGGHRNFLPWAREFERLLEQYAYKEIKQTLLWYADHVNDEYVPQLFSAKTFCRNYEKMLRAIQRQKRDAERERYRNMTQDEKIQQAIDIQQTKEARRAYKRPSKEEYQRLFG